MSNTVIYIIVAVSVVVVLATVFIFLRISNHKKAKKLQENLKKLKQEDKNQELEEKNITLVAEQRGENVSEDEIFGDVGQTSGGGFFTSGKKEENLDEINFDEEYYQPKEEDVPRMPNRPSYREEDRSRQERERDFEKFMDEHAFSRKVFDKTLLDKIKKLPPEIKSIIMGNVFDKFNGDDDK